MLLLEAANAATTWPAVAEQALIVGFFAWLLYLMFRRN